MDNKRKLRKSRKQERDGARRYGGVCQPQSGAGMRKLDVRTPTELIEFKRTDADSYRLKADDLTTASRHALLDGLRRMLFIIEFGRGDRYVVLSEDDYLELRGE